VARLSEGACGACSPIQDPVPQGAHRPERHDPPRPLRRLRTRHVTAHSHTNDQRRQHPERASLQLSFLPQGASCAGSTGPSTTCVQPLARDMPSTRLPRPWWHASNRVSRCWSNPDRDQPGSRHTDQTPSWFHALEVRTGLPLARASSRTAIVRRPTARYSTT